jgi:hypothetical protein
LIKAQDNPLVYLTTGELIGIILSESYWKYFKSWFAGSADAYRAKLNEISCLRNAFAHFRAITPVHVDTLKRNANALLGRFEDRLMEMLSFRTEPLKTWTSYIPVTELNETKAFHFQLQVSPSRDWLVIDMTAPIKILGEPSVCGNIFSWPAMGLSADAVLSEFPSIRSKVIFVTHDLFHSSSTWDGDSAMPEVKKRLRFVFTCAKEEELDVLNFRQYLIDQELYFISTDLPKSLFRAGNVSATETKKENAPSDFQIHAGDFLKLSEVNRCLENWGGLHHDCVYGNLLTSIPWYPFMDHEISDTAK